MPTRTPPRISPSRSRGRWVRERIAAVFAALGFSKLKGRHWERGAIFVEVPGHHIDEPFVEHAIGPYHLRVIRAEVLLVEREVEFDQTGHTGHAAQAVVLLATAGDTLDPILLAKLVRRERVDAVHQALSELAASGIKVTNQLLHELHDRLHNRGRYAPGYISPEDTDRTPAGGTTSEPE